MVQRQILLFSLMLLAGSACGESQSSSSANVTIDEEPTRGMLILKPAGTADLPPADSAVAEDSASSDNPIIVVDGERLPLTRQR
jgi:hypothetical protein